jgi:hypothetical protein
MQFTYDFDLNENGTKLGNTSFYYFVVFPLNEERCRRALDQPVRRL